jgi:hypothetical protein
MADLRSLAEAYLSECAASHGKVRWIDKTPNYVTSLSFLEELFGRDAQYIMLVRHPLDTAASLAAMPAFMVDDPEDPVIATSVRRYGRDTAAWVHHWVDMTRAVINFTDSVRDRTRIIRYEDLVHSPADMLSQVLAFLGEARQPELVADMLARGLAWPHSSGYQDPRIRSTRAVHCASVGKWKAWPVADIDRLWAIAATCALRLGYSAPTSGLDRARRGPTTGPEDE